MHEQWCNLYPKCYTWLTIIWKSRQWGPVWMTTIYFKLKSWIFLLQRTFKNHSSHSTFHGGCLFVVFWQGRMMMHLENLEHHYNLTWYLTRRLNCFESAKRWSKKNTQSDLVVWATLWQAVHPRVATVWLKIFYSKNSWCRIYRAWKMWLKFASLWAICTNCLQTSFVTKLYFGCCCCE